MSKRLFLLDGMALVYRGHFALAARPIFTSKGVNTSALYVFTQTLLDIINNQKPTHLAVSFDTEKATARHAEFAEYKATREAMPEDIVAALPHVYRMLDAFNVPIVNCDGYEADDVIGTLVQKAEKEGFSSYMVTMDKDFGQLVTERTFLYKVSRMGDAVEILGIPEIRKRWNIEKPEQVIDILGLMGDSSDNIPGVPGVGEKTAMKLVAEFGSIENVLANTDKLKPKLKENFEKFRDQALMSKRLATIDRKAPCEVDLESLKAQPPDEEKLKALLVEFEFNTIGRRLFGDNFKAGRGFQLQSDTPEDFDEQVKAAAPAANLKTLKDVPHEYVVLNSASQKAEVLSKLLKSESVALQIQLSDEDPKLAKILALAFSVAPYKAWVVPLPDTPAGIQKELDGFRPFFESETIEKVGHNLKAVVSALAWGGIPLRGKLFDTMIAHSLIDPELRHSVEFVAEACLGYTPISHEQVFGKQKADQMLLSAVPSDQLVNYAAEQADLAWQFRTCLEPQLKERKQEKVFYDIEAPLIPVLASMEREGIRLDARAMGEFSEQLSTELTTLEKTICGLAGKTFNINSSRQLGEILFDALKVCANPKKTRTGQFATDEATLQALVGTHPIVQHLLDYRAATKLKSTYADALPAAIFPKTSRVHTTYQQTATSTGRLNSQNPNLQNIPIRRERGQEIRRAFVPRDGDYLLLSADYSQIELRIIAALSRESGLLEAFKTDADVHTATAAKVFGVADKDVTSEMRRQAKMVNYGIAYGISAFGLAQRLGIPRKEAAGIIDQYFKQFPGIARYMDETIEFARKHGYVETVTGRRRYMRDVRSSNATIRAGAERNAINAPIQGTAADMIKIAMVNIHRELAVQGMKTRMLLQVHDELVFDLHKSEKETAMPLIEEKMKSAIPLEVPIVVEMGVGENWLEAH